ncbi:MAG: polyprenyl synthetase family protein, partial [Candidatus Cryptobacteroides sp.]
SDLAEGEMYQLEKAGAGDTTEEDYNRIIYSKTASLFEAAAVSAVVSVNAPASVEDAVKRYAVALGMAFQIRDDIFDYFCPSDSVGKPVGVDIEEKKVTLPLIGAMKNAGPEEEAEVRRKICALDDHPGYKDEIIAFVKEHGGLRYASSRLDSYIAEAVGALDSVPESEERETLRSLAYFVGVRLS